MSFLRSLLPVTPAWRWLVLAGLALAGCAQAPGQRKLAIAAAADLNFALEQLSNEFRAAHPEVVLDISYGSSGNLYTQIRNLAPFDVFLSADADYPRKLLEEGIGAADSFFVYAVGQIVVWVPDQSPLDPAAALREPSLSHLAIANPKHAPYGRAAEAALRSMGLYDSVEKKLVLGENIAQTLQFVESGAAGAGIVALSLAVAPRMHGRGRYWEIPVTAYPKMEQAGIVLKPSRAASAFRSFLLSTTGRRILKQYGFAPGG